MASAIEAAVEEIRSQVAGHVEALKSHEAMGSLLKAMPALNSLEDMLGQPRTSIAALFGGMDIGASGDGGAGSRQSTTGSAVSRVRFDEFYGVGMLDAAKRYLKKCTNARPFQEIVEAVQAGGGKVESENDLRTGLSRSTLDVVKIGDSYGLLEHYPHIKRGGKKRKNAPNDGSAADTATAAPVIDEPDSEIEGGN